MRLATTLLLLCCSTVLARAQEAPPPSPAAGAIAEGRKQLAARRYTDALTTFDRAVQLDPASWVGWYYRGNTHVLLRQYAQAIPDLDRALALGPPAPRALGMVHLRRGWAKMSAADAAGALADFSRGIEVHPSNPVGYQYRVQLRLLTDQPQLAVPDIKVLYKLDAKRYEPLAQRLAMHVTAHRGGIKLTALIRQLVRALPGWRVSGHRQLSPKMITDAAVGLTPEQISAGLADLLGVQSIVLRKGSAQCFLVIAVGKTPAGAAAFSTFDQALLAARFKTISTSPGYAGVHYLTEPTRIDLGGVKAYYSAMGYKQRRQEATSCAVIQTHGRATLELTLLQPGAKPTVDVREPAKVLAQALSAIPGGR